MLWGVPTILCTADNLEVVSSSTKVNKLTGYTACALYTAAVLQFHATKPNFNMIMWGGGRRRSEEYVYVKVGSCSMLWVKSSPPPHCLPMFRCECVASFDGTSTAYDCSSCEEGEAFQSVQSVTAQEGDYGLFSTDGTGHSPTSVLSDSDGDSAETSLGQELKGE